jgi:DNA-binding NarL/FixJ family response regulator
MEEAQRLCDRIAVFKQGRVAALDTPAGLIRRSAGGTVISFAPSRPLDDGDLAGLPEAETLERRNGRLTIHGTDATVNAVISLLARHQITAHQLRVTDSTAGSFVTAVTMAGAQAGGFPPKSPGQVAAFGGLLVLNSTLVFFFGALADREAEQARVQAETISELERTNARLQQALAENAGLQAQLIVQAREAGVSDERRRLAAEIHDTIAQGLTGIITQLQAAEDSEHVRRATDLARESLREARRSVQDLAPTHLEHDTLPEALKKITDGRAHLTITGTAEPLHDELEATLLRVAQEAVANAPRDDLFNAVRAAAEGRPVLSPAIASRLVSRVREPRSESLSTRELQVLRLVARGTSNREIATELFISEATVKTHLTHIYAKLDVKDRAAAVATAYDKHLLP